MGSGGRQNIAKASGRGALGLVYFSLLLMNRHLETKSHQVITKLLKCLCPLTLISCKIVYNRGTLSLIELCLNSLEISAFTEIAVYRMTP